ncbi:MAG: ComF family protein [Clostridia bacterium]|nr:ComF family protein [Clostridia bacterium]
MNIRQNLTKFKNKVLDIIFPNGFSCIFCGREIPQGDICDRCTEKNIFNTGNRCQLCDTPIKEGNIVCDHCKSHKRAFKSVSCPLLYENEIRSSILKFKSDGAKYLAKPFAKLIFDRLTTDDIQFDIIVPVPSHKKTIRKRGYNPARVLADELSLLTGKPVADILIKTVQTKNQKLLNFNERQTNLENSMTITDANFVKGKKVLIIDDIITTAATVNACALLMHKASEIYACAIARRSL